MIWQVGGIIMMIVMMIIKVGGVVIRGEVLMTILQKWAGSGWCKKWCDCDRSERGLWGFEYNNQLL